VVVMGRREVKSSAGYGTGRSGMGGSPSTNGRGNRKKKKGGRRVIVRCKD